MGSKEREGEGQREMRQRGEETRMILERVDRRKKRGQEKIRDDKHAEMGRGIGKEREQERKRERERERERESH